MSEVGQALMKSFFLLQNYRQRKKSILHSHFHSFGLFISSLLHLLFFLIILPLKLNTKSSNHLLWQEDAVNEVIAKMTFKDDADQSYSSRKERKHYGKEETESKFKYFFIFITSFKSYCYCFFLLFSFSWLSNCFFTWRERERETVAPKHTHLIYILIYPGWHKRRVGGSDCGIPYGKQEKEGQAVS